MDEPVSGVPPSGVPPSGVPPSGVPPSGVPPSGVPPSELERAPSAGPEAPESAPPPEGGFFQNLAHEFGPLFAGLDARSTVVVLLSTVALIVFHENGSTSFFRAHFAHYFEPTSFSGLYPAFYWYGTSLVLLMVIPLLVGRYCLHTRWSDWGVGLGDVRFGLTAAVCFYLAFLPILVAVSYTGAFQSKYPLFSEARLSFGHLVSYEIAYALYFVGWEFVFRGFMLFGLWPRFRGMAVLVQTIPFAIMHFGKPEIETLAAILAGVILGVLALRTRSFWYGWLLHALVAVTNDLLAMAHKGILPA